MQLSSLLSGLQQAAGSFANRLGDEADKATASGSNFADLLQAAAGEAKTAAAKAQGVDISAEETKLRAKIDTTGKAFEANVLSSLMQSMFKTVSAGEFGGGEGEEQFKSLLVDAMAKQVSNQGGFGIAERVSREMLKMQGLTDLTAPAPSTATTA